MESCKIDNATPRDLHSILKISSDCGLSPWSHRDYVDEMVRTDSIVIKAICQDDDCAGFMVGRRIPAASSDAVNDVEIYNIGVRPEKQGRSIGSHLMLEFIKRCRRRRIGTIWLDVRRSNDIARSFYRKFGFVDRAVRRSFYSDPDEDGMVMMLKITV